MHFLNRENVHFLETNIKQADDISTPQSHLASECQARKLIKCAYLKFVGGECSRALFEWGKES